MFIFILKLSVQVMKLSTCATTSFRKITLKQSMLSGAGYEVKMFSTWCLAVVWL